MSTGLPSDEVAEDYKIALEDLVTNDRYQIANLTMIAKENIEHAEAISRVLTNHINRAPPSRKLPALYVLDSLVKNIGSPYTVYFGRNLHSTFMLAYPLVDAAIRRKLEEMLRTWREPIPGSLATTPVFPLQSTQSIVDTLNRYRVSTAGPTSRLQSAPNPAVRPSSGQRHRDTPTPPTIHKIPHSQPSSTIQYPSVQGQQYATNIVSQPSIPNSNYGSMNAPNQVDLAKLHADIDDLTTDAKIECATHPMDITAQRKLITLQTLKELLDAGSTSDQDLVDIQNTIKQEMEKKIMSQNRIVHQPPPVTYHQQQQPIYPSQSPAPAIPSFLNQANLAALLQATASHQSTPQPQNNITPAYNTPPVHHAVPMSSAPPAFTVPSNTLNLMDQLRASGWLPSTNPVVDQPNLPLRNNNDDDIVQMTSASIRIRRPQKVLAFLESRPNQCSTCGRRFTSDDIGREKKARHLDWHFKTKARMLEAEKRGQNRSWYVDQREWIASRDHEDDEPEENAGTSNSAANGKQATQSFVRAPTDPTLRNAPCPIDQEPFKSEWSEEVQDFIWKDAIRVGNRYYHASCYREVTKDRDKDGALTPLPNGTIRTATPDSVLGKRKAAGIENSVKTRMKLEP